MTASLLVVVGALAASADVVPSDPGAYNCHGHLQLHEVEKPGLKGMTLDDTTLVNCSGQMLEYWPQSSPTDYQPTKRVKNLRIFRAWATDWPEAGRYPAWMELMKYVKQQNVKVLIGTTISCFPDEDWQVWQWTKELITWLGRERLLGLSVGNELEIFHMFRKELEVDDACLHRFWEEGYVLNWFKHVVADFDALGYNDLPVTTVFGGFALNSNTSTFHDSWVARVDPLLSQLSSTYGERFVFAFNLYPYFDPSLKLDNDKDDHCIGTLSETLCWEHNCDLPAQIAVAREKITNLTGNPSWRMWLTEVGWASKYAPTLTSAMRKCKEYSSVESLLTFYKGFLAWNLSIGDAAQSLTPPELAFWHTMRDSPQLGTLEHFGLVAQCGDARCKTVQDANILAVPHAPPGFVKEAEKKAQKEAGLNMLLQSSPEGSAARPESSSYGWAASGAIALLSIASLSAMSFCSARKHSDIAGCEEATCESDSSSSA